MTKKTWTEKLNSDHGLPKVEPMPESMRGRFGDGRLLIAAPRQFDALMKRVPKGKLTTINVLREVLAKRHRATITCAMTAGMFANFAARAADEAEQAGQKRVTPYWRTLKAGGELNPKFPGGLAVLRSRLEAEGHSIVVRGKRMFVADHEQCLVRPAAE